MCCRSFFLLLVWCGGKLELMPGLDMFYPKEKFLLVEISPQKTSGVLFSFGGDKYLKPIKFFNNFSFGKLSGDPLRNLRTRKVIVSAYPPFSTDIFYPVEFIRKKEDSSRPFSHVEAENIFSEALGRLFINHRIEAASRMGIHELDAVLVGVKASNFKIDGHVVFNPLNFRGKKLEAVLRLTFTTRAIFDDLHDFFKAKDGFYFLSAPLSAASLVSKIDSSPAHVAFVSHRETYLYKTLKMKWGSDISEERIGWTLESLTGQLASSMGIDQSAIPEIYGRYIEGRSSQNFEKAIQNITNKSLKNLLQSIKSKSVNGNLYIFSPLTLNFKYPFRCGRSTVNNLPIDVVLNKFGVNLEREKWDLGYYEMFMLLSAFIETHFDKNDSEVNKLLKRRLHWLIN